MPFEPYLLPAEPLTSWEAYRAWGGGLGIERAVQLGPERVIAEVTASGIRGRGGGGFPTGRKWASIRGDGSLPTAVVANGAEGEPATYKDRALLASNAYQVVEGLVIAAYAVGAEDAYIAIKASFVEQRLALEQAIAELQRAGVCTDCRIEIVGGPQDYLFGEETGLLEVVEGKAPLPRIQPPYVEGLFSRPDRPTVALVNNVETLAHVTTALARGAEWFRARGTEGSPGHGIATIVGDVRRPGVREFELGAPVRQLVDDVGGGPHPGRALKAVVPGVANAVLTDAELDTPASFEHLAAVGSGLGSAGFAAYDDTACMVEVARQASAFLAKESCGQCPPCKLGSESITAHLATIEAGSASPPSLEQLAGQLERVTDANRCYLGTQERIVVTSILQKFPDEVAEHLAGRCPRQRPIDFPWLR